MTTATASRPVQTRQPQQAPTDHNDLMERETPVALEAMTRGEVDVQISTARRYPRSIRTFIQKALEMATLDEETAKACFYALPRDGKTVSGPSARLAEICASAYGHLRVASRIVDEDDRFITAGAMAWDVENNVAIGFEVRRRITKSNHQKYSDDMIVVTGNAAASIALRNAVFKVIPSAFWRPIYEQARVVAVGNAQTLASRRLKMLEHFQKLGIDNGRVFAVLNVKGIEDITLEHMETLIGVATAIKEGDTDIDTAFPATLPMPKRTDANGNGQQTAAAPQPPAAQTPAAEETPSAIASTAPSDPPAPSAQASLPDGLDRIVTFQNAAECKWKVGGAAFTERGIKLFTVDETIASAMQGACNTSALIELTYGQNEKGRDGRDYGHRVKTIRVAE